MSFFRKLIWLTQRRRKEEELREELQFHLDEEAAEINDHYAARRGLGNITIIQENTRSAWGWTFVEQMIQDLRYGLRAIGHNRAFTAVAVLSLALGIGANTAIYSFMDAILLRALPVSSPQNLVILNWHSKGQAPLVHDHWGGSHDEGNGGEVSPDHPYPAYELLRDKNTVLSSLFGYKGIGRLNVLVDGQAELDQGQCVTGNFFSSLGVQPAAGRLIGPEDDREGAPQVSVITYDYWRSRFASDPAVLGKLIQINGSAFTIVGVSAPEFYGVSPQDKPAVFLPMVAEAAIDTRNSWQEMKHDGTFYWLDLMGRLKPGITLQQAQAELAVMYHGFVESTATKDRERANLPTLKLQEGATGFDSLRRQYSKPLWILMTMVGLILTIACANAANLLLARASARRREMAVRLSLGAGRFRIIRQLLTESVLLAAISGLLGVGIAALGIRFLTFLLTNGANNKLTVNVGLDWRVLSFTVLVALATGLLFGLAPAFEATKVDVAPALKENRASAVRNHIRRFHLPFGLSHVLVVSQIAMSLLLVMAAGLFVRTLSNLHSVNLGFNSENILLFSLDANKAGFKPDAANHLYDELNQRFLNTPGVSAATVSNIPLVGDWSSTTNVEVPGIPKPPEGQRGPHTSYARVGPTFFETMQMPIVLGRPFNDRDRGGAQPVAVVNQVFVQNYFPAVNPIGRHFKMGGDKNSVELEIVGVAKNARYSSLRDEIPSVTFTPYLQAAALPQHDMFFELRTATSDPLALGNSIREIVRQVAPHVPLGAITTQQRRIDATIQNERTFASLCTCFAVLALVIACVGLYGTMSYNVARRTGEIGIRMALGAQRRAVVWLVQREVVALALAGLAISIPIALASSKVIESFLFGMKPNDPAALMIAVAILAAAALLAGYLPARKASRIDPMIALRHE